MSYQVSVGMTQSGRSGFFHGSFLVAEFPSEKNLPENEAEAQACLDYLKDASKMLRPYEYEPKQMLDEHYFRKFRVLNQERNW